MMCPNIKILANERQQFSSRTLCYACCPNLIDVKHNVISFSCICMELVDTLFLSKIH